MLPGQLCCLWGSWWGFCSDSNNMITQLQHQRWTPWPAVLNPLLSQPHSSFFNYPKRHPKEFGRWLSKHFFFLFRGNAWCYFEDMNGSVSHMLISTRSCCESMSCALASCSKTNLVDFHNYYNLIMNPSVWTVHRTACQRSHASHCEMQKDCVPSETVLRWDETSLENTSINYDS